MLVVVGAADDGRRVAPGVGHGEGVHQALAGRGHGRSTRADHARFEQRQRHCARRRTRDREGVEV